MNDTMTLLQVNEIISYAKSNAVLQDDEYILIVHPTSMGPIMRWRNEARGRRAFLRKRTGRRTP